MTVLEVLEQAKALSPQERKQLMKLLVDTFDVPVAVNMHSILEFEGIASHLADNEDPQDYVSRLRSEWDD
jgi:hypothetical protein